jgi:uncharacterized membrane protein
MAASAENRHNMTQNRTLNKLSPQVAAMLSYIGGWVSGIVILVLEQKNRFVRFHALQSIIVFGALSLAEIVLGSIPIIGGGFHWLIFVIGFILWIVLVVKALNGEVYKMPWAGDLAERLANESTGQDPDQSRQAEGLAVPPPPVTPIRPVNPENHSQGRPGSADIFRDRYYSLRARAARVAGSALAIAWSVALIIFFNFYNQYIAYYEPVHSNGVTHWQIYTLITPAFSDWLPVLTVTLVMTILGHILLISFDKYILRQVVRIILAVFGIATVVTLLSLFPFNFSPIPNLMVADGISLGLTVFLIVLTVGYAIGTIVRFIQLIVHMVEGKY